MKIYPEVHKDNRGYFFESFKQNEFKDNKLEINIVLDNHAKSTKGVLRGLH